MKRGLVLGVATLVLAHPFHSVVGLAAGCAGSLDASFDARIVEDQPYIRSLAVQSNGWVILAGSDFTVPGAEFHGLARFRTDGSLDASFAPVVEGGEVKALAVQPDGMLLLGGSFTSVNGVARHGLARLHSDGTLDATFLPPDLGPESVDIQSLALRADGKVLAGGGAEGSDRQLFRFHPDGTLDTSFQATNRLAWPVGFILVQPDGRLLVSGTVRLEDEVRVQITAVTRLNPDGFPDEAFAPPMVANAFVRAAALQPDGKILLGMEIEYPPSFTHSKPFYGSVIRLNADGSRDATFASGLMTETDARPAEWVGSMVGALAVQADGRILIGGGFDYVNQVRRACVARLHPDGSLDSSFETDIAYHPDCDRVEALSTMALAPGDTLVIGGYLNEINALTRHGLARLHLAGTAPVGVIAFTTNFHRVSENAGQFDVPVGRSGDLSRSVTVNYTTWDPGTADLTGAREGEDYLGRSGTLVFGPGDSTQTIRLPLLSNGAPEANEELALILSDPTGGALLGYPAQTRVLLLDQETLGQPGSLDESFTSPFPFGTLGAFAGVRQVRWGADGSIWAAGAFTAAACDYCGGLARLSADGVRDTGFAPDIAGQVWAVQPLPGGQLLIGGDFAAVNGTPCASLARLGADGSLDSTFTAAPVGNVTQIERLADGRLVIGGFHPVTSGARTNFIRRLLASGAPDPTFSNAVATISETYGVVDRGDLFDLVVQPDGKVLLTGRFGRLGDAPCPGLARLNEDGSRDATFVPPSRRGSDLALQPDGRILVAGVANAGGENHAGILRLNSDGSLDPTFNAGASLSGYVTSVALQTDGKPIVGGCFTRGSAYSLNVARLNADGSFDATFNVGSGARGVCPCVVAVLPDGRILVGGGFDSVNGLSQRFIARLNGGVAHPVLLPPVRQANGELCVTTMGLEVGIQYSLETSTNLTDWRVIGTDTAITNGLRFIVTEPSAQIQQFYRVHR